MSTTQERIAAALAATAGGITMDTSTIEKRFAEVRDRGAQDRRRRRRMVVGAGGLVAAAALVGAFVLAGALDGQDTATPQIADQVEPEPATPRVVVTREVFPQVGTRYVAEDFAVPFSLQVPETGDVPGRWRIGPPEEEIAGVGLDGSASTGFAAVDLLALEQAYAPDRPWTEQDALVEAPQGADGWARWFEATGFAQVSDQEEVTVAGLPGRRMTVTVAEDLPPAYDGCAPSTGCLGLRPFGATPGSGFQAGLFEGSVVEVVVLEPEGRTVLVNASGEPDTKDQWLPLLRSVVDSLRLE